MMPKDSDMFAASTEKDGSVNGEYCSYCYDAGEFNMSDTIKTASDMQEMVKNQLKKNVQVRLKDGSILLEFLNQVDGKSDK